MATVSFTHRIDAQLKADLEEIAGYENRSASFIANQAIQNFVEERKATRELIETGLELIERGAPAIAAEDIHAWMLSDDDNAPSPEPRSVS
ncbi:MAG: CopG family ribbon-helix-helix protein [Paracoccus sp. (in: a-proteobacteria)]